MREIVTAVEMKELDHNTIQKAGISSPVLMENNAGWHGSAPNEEQYNQAIAELDEIIKGLEASL